MTHLKSFCVFAGDCPVPTLVECWGDGSAHELRCGANVLRLERPPKRVDLLLVSDPRFAPDSERMFG